MRLYRNVLWTVWGVLGGAAVLMLAGAAEASLIQNGNFESVTDNKFDYWTYQGPGAYVEAAEVISGARTAGILTGGGAPSNISQVPLEAISGFVFECDFAVFPVLSTGNRSLNVQFSYGTGMINLRVGPNNVLQAYDSTTTTWQPLTSVLGPLTALTTTDIGNDGVWNGETPVVNHLMVIGRLASTGSTYDVILNGLPVSGLSYFQYNAPNQQNRTITSLQLHGWISDKNWLVDNVVFMRIPEPSSGVLLGVGGLLGLTALMRRRRRQPGFTDRLLCRERGPSP